MKKLLPLLLAVMVCLSACSAGGQTSQNTLEVYFPVPLTELPDGGSSVETVRFEVPHNADRASSAMELLIAGTEGYESPYARGVKLVSISYESGGLIVELSPEYYDMSDAARAVADACAALTLCAIEGVEAVRFGDGAQLSVDSIITGSLAPESLERELTLYFTDSSLSYVVAETRRVLLRDGETPDRYAAEELLKGPDMSGLQSTLPEGTVLVSISREDTACYVNLSAEFRQLREASLAQEVRALYAVANSMCGIEGIESVYFLINGELLYDGAEMRASQSVVGELPRDTAEYTVYLPSLRSDYFEPVKARVSIGEGYGAARLVVEYLLGGIDGSGFLSPLPGGTRINSVTISGGKCVVDFSRELVQNSENAVYDPTITQVLALTLAENFSGISQVEVQVNGTVVDRTAPNRNLIHPDSLS